MNWRIPAFLVAVGLFAAFIIFKAKPQLLPTILPGTNQVIPQIEADPLMISEMRKKNYPGSDFVIEQTLQDGSNYHQYVASYKSDGLKVYGLLTVPIGQKPQGGWSVIVFNHGYIPPAQYRTTEKYVVYVDYFARNGYVVFKSDYRGHGSSEGSPEGAYYSPAYTVDILNALASLKRYPEVNSNKIGMWGHSLGGNITLRLMVISPPDIKAGVIWGGVVGSYDDLINNWRRRTPFRLSPQEQASRNRTRLGLVNKYGSPSANPKFWDQIDPTAHLDSISGPIQLHHGLDDEEVPWQFSSGLKESLDKQNKSVEYYTYPGGDHNISSPNFELAMQRSLEFFNKYLK